MQDDDSDINQAIELIGKEMQTGIQTLDIKTGVTRLGWIYYAFCDGIYLASGTTRLQAIERATEELRKCIK